MKDYLNRAIEQAIRARTEPRLPVIQRGRKIGTVPGDFDPINIKSTTFLYDVRPGDFVRSKDRKNWIASDDLGPGDFEAMPEFIWDRAE